MSTANPENQLNTASNPSVEQKAESDSIKRIRQRTKLYSTLEKGFGKEIAKELSIQVVNTFETVRNILNRFNTEYF